MKIRFFKGKEPSMYWNTYPNFLDIVKPKEFPKRNALLKMVVVIGNITAFLLCFFFQPDYSGSGQWLRAFWLSYLILFVVFVAPIHEFLHVLAAKILKKPVEGVYFFPEKFKFFSPGQMGAYVILGASIYTKKERIIISATPLAFFLFTSLLVSIFIPQLRLAMIGFILCKILESMMDIFNIIDVLRLPKGALCFYPFFWFTVDPDKRVCLEYMTANDKKTEFIHRVFICQNGKVTKRHPQPGPDAFKAKEAFEEQLGYELHWELPET